MVLLNNLEASYDEVRVGDLGTIYKILSNDMGKVPVLYFHIRMTQRNHENCLEMYEIFKRELIPIYS